MYGIGDKLPAVYAERLRTEIYDERVAHLGPWYKVVVVAREDDAHTMLNHALIQSRRRYRAVVASSRVAVVGEPRSRAVTRTRRDRILGVGTSPLLRKRLRAEHRSASRRPATSRRVS